jgi:signal transduction histidine kinase
MDEDSEEHTSNQHQKEENLFLSVSVSDTGCGMNEEMRKKCFTLFGNLKFKKDINQGGMGLGLASANLICKALQGELNLIRSEENEGSKFQFTMVIKMGNAIDHGGLLSIEGANHGHGKRRIKLK